MSNYNLSVNTEPSAYEVEEKIEIHPILLENVNQLQDNYIICDTVDTPTELSIQGDEENNIEQLKCCKCCKFCKYSNKCCNCCCCEDNCCKIVFTNKIISLLFLLTFIISLIAFLISIAVYFW